MTAEDLRIALIRADEVGDTESAKALALQLQALEGGGAGAGPGQGEAAGKVPGQLEPGGTTRRWGSIAAAAPAKALGGLIDTAGWLNDKTTELVAQLRGKNVSGVRSSDLTSKVNALTDEMAGEQVPQTTARAVVEGAIGAPLSGSAGVRGMIAGGAGGGAADAVLKMLPKDTPEWQRVMTALVSSMLAGKAAGSVGLPGASGAKAKVREAGSELTKADWDEALARSRNVREAGGDMLPSQAFPYPAPGIDALEQSLLSSHLGGADQLRRRAVQQPRQADRARQELTAAMLTANNPPNNPRVAALLQPPVGPQVEAAREGARRAAAVLSVGEGVSVPRRGAVPSVSGEATRAALGTQGMVANVIAGGVRGLTGHAVDRALLRIWNAPDGMERLARIAQTPANQLTPATILAVLPELQENEDVAR